MRRIVMPQIFIWAKKYQENWSAFAPDFRVRNTGCGHAVTEAARSGEASEVLALR